MFQLLKYKYNTFKVIGLDRTQKKNLLPKKFRILTTISWILVLAPIFFMILDFCLQWKALSIFAYIFAIACALVLLITTKIATKEWVEHVSNSTQETNILK